MNQMRELILAFHDHAVLHGEFELSGGARSHYFIEAQRALLTQPCFEIVGALLADMCDDLMVTAIGGPATGAIAPVCAALSQRKGLRGFYISGPLPTLPVLLGVSGQLAPRDRVLLVDDVLTTGHSLQRSIDFLRDHEGIDPLLAITIVDRSTEKVQLTIPHTSLITADDIVEKLAPAS